MIANKKPEVLFLFNRRVRETYISPDELARLESFANWNWFECNGGNIYQAHENPETIQQLCEQVKGVDGMVVCHGAPRINEKILEHAPNLKIIGELEGDRFAVRIDLETCWQL